jgi:hypothetical protein
LDRGETRSRALFGTVAGTMLSLERQAMAVALVLGATLIAIFELTGLASYEVYMGQPIVDAIFIVLGLGLFFYGLVNPLLLPRINEQAALSVHTTVLLSLALTGWNEALRAYLIAPVFLTLVLAYLGLSRRSPSPTVKALVYLWYLITLLGLTLQNDFSSLTQPASTPLPLTEAFVVGAAGVFLLLHGLFLVRFALIVSSLIIPRNRHYITDAMPRLFTDEQIPRWQVVVIPVLIAGIFAANSTLDAISDRTIANVLVLTLVQGVFEIPRRRADPKPSGN